MGGKKRHVEVLEREDEVGETWMSLAEVKSGISRCWGDNGDAI